MPDVIVLRAPAHTYLDGVEQALGVAPVQQMDVASPRVRGQEDRIRGRVSRPLQAPGQPRLAPRQGVEGQLWVWLVWVGVGEKS